MADDEDDRVLNIKEICKKTIRCDFRHEFQNSFLEYFADEHNINEMRKMDKANIFLTVKNMSRFQQIFNKKIVQFLTDNLGLFS